jgi:hypothetical protein
MSAKKMKAIVNRALCKSTGDAGDNDIVRIIINFQVE